VKPRPLLRRRVVESELRVKDFALGGNNLEAYYFEQETEGLRAMAIDPDVDPERRRLWELVAHGMERVPSTTRRLIGRAYESGGFYFFGAVDERRPDRGADPLAVRAVFEVIEELEPGWVQAVEEARGLADAPAVLAAWCGLPIEAVLAVLGNWRTRL
jgi:hypothetical protein